MVRSLPESFGVFSVVRSHLEPSGIVWSRVESSRADQSRSYPESVGFGVILSLSEFELSVVIPSRPEAGAIRSSPEFAGIIRSYSESSEVIWSLPESSEVVQSLQEPIGVEVARSLSELELSGIIRSYLESS